MSQRIKKNLQSATEGDAVDAATYQRFAAYARMERDSELAQAFQEIANEISRCARFEAILADIGMPSSFEAIAQ
jgi:rubrerythrin